MGNIVVSTVLADARAPLGAGASAGMVVGKFGSLICTGRVLERLISFEGHFYKIVKEHM